ncbi:MAG TPA: LacI family DNA-binding transcriptional regulator [Streptosporangiaceae bacterium]|nr:LacI family DNA-binding transcriptional regulator [Streptosporangiaceae bacterium]
MSEPDGGAGGGRRGRGPAGGGTGGGGPAGGAAAAAGTGRRAPRLVDIAQAAGVHVSTVSRVLNGDPALSIRPETYERVLRTAQAQGYRPNALARALKRRRTGAFAMVIPLLRNPIWVRLQRGALQRARERGYVVLIMEEPTDDPRPPDEYRYLVEESRVDGLLLATALRVPEHQPGVTAVPHVYVNRRGPDRGHDVVMDEAGAVQLFIDHVAGLGHRSVALIDGPADVDTVFRRVSAARRLCAARGLSLSVRHAPATEDGGWDAGLRMLRRDPQPTAVGVGSINQLFGLLGALRTASVSVPGQMSVVSFDEDECLAFLDVPVTSVCMPLAELGTTAVDALIARIEGQPAQDELVREPMSLVLRSSAAPPPGAGQPAARRPGTPGTRTARTRTADPHPTRTPEAAQPAAWRPS